MKRRYQFRIGPGNDAVNVIELRGPVKDDLMGDLHHPIGAALGVGGDEDVVPGWNIVAERIMLRQPAIPAGGHRS